MGLRTVLKKGLSKGFEPKRWVGLEHVKSNGKLCVSLVNEYFSKGSNEEEKLEELPSSMSSDEIKKRKKIAFYLSLSYFVLSLSAVAYALYLWFSDSFILAGCMSNIIAFLLANYSLRELMLYAQIRLGVKRVSFKNLFSYLIKGFPS